jgi:CubicO group peptidase (beta-lactamase class C family)
MVKMQSINDKIRPILEDFVARGVERGLQAAAYVNGELVLDVWAGVADAASGRPVDGDTLFTTWSASKGVGATAVHVLAERGALRYDMRVAELWPEFAVQGKQEITVAQVLAHTSAIPQVPDGVTPEEILDWERIVRRVAALTPLWKPGTATGYHAMNYGWLVGELVRRASGRPFDEFVRAEIFAPLGIRDLYFGVTPEAEARVATLEEGPAAEPVEPAPEIAVPVVATPPWRVPPSPWANQPAVRRASIPSSGMIGNARSLAAHYAGLLDGRLLPDARVRAARALQIDAVDVTTGTPARRALGYGLGGPLSAQGASVSAFGHGGLGGTAGFADPERGLAFALTKNRLRYDAPGTDVAYVVAEAVRALAGLAR